MELKREDPTRLAQNENKIQARTPQSLHTNFKQTQRGRPSRLFAQTQNKIRARTPQSLLTNFKQNSSDPSRFWQTQNNTQARTPQSLSSVNSKQNSSKDTLVALNWKRKTNFKRRHPSSVKVKLKEGHLSRFVYPSWAACCARQAERNRTAWSAACYDGRQVEPPVEQPDERRVVRPAAGIWLFGFLFTLVAVGGSKLHGNILPKEWLELE